MTIIALLQARDEERYLKGWLENVAPAVDGIVALDDVSIDGTAVPVFVIQTKSSFTGSTPGTRTDTIRWSPKHSLPVAWTITQKTGGSSDYQIDAQMTLTSLTPLT